MDETEQNDTENRRETGPIRVVETVRGQIDGNGKLGVYSYTVVYTQESLRVLDLRFNPAKLREPQLLYGVLRTRWRNAGYDDSQIFVEGEPTGLNG